MDLGSAASGRGVRACRWLRLSPVRTWTDEASEEIESMIAVGCAQIWGWP